MSRIDGIQEKKRKRKKKEYNWIGYKKTTMKIEN
jgi:hypothetical protein